jgi:hypothetical protein
VNPKDLVGAKKAPLALVPQALIIGAAEAMANGAEKYGPFNWREYPVQVMTYVEAAQRHLAAFVDGQDDAEDTGIHHLKHVVAGMGILLDSIALGIAEDNRPPAGPAADLLRQQDKTTGTDTIDVTDLAQFFSDQQCSRCGTKGLHVCPPSSWHSVTQGVDLSAGTSYTVIVEDFGEGDGPLFRLGDEE